MVNMLVMSSMLCGTNDFHMIEDNTIFQELSLLPTYVGVHVSALDKKYLGLREPSDLGQR